MVMTAGRAATDGRPCYLLPLRWQADSSGLAGLTGYLRHVSATCDVMIVDGSLPLVFARHHRSWSAFARHIPPTPTWFTAMARSMA
jgi:hypothetical protein